MGQRRWEAGGRAAGGGVPAAPAQLQDTIMLSSGWVAAVPDNAHYPKPILKALT